MRILLCAAVLAALLVAVPGSDAQNKIYTWTDARGNVHITDEAPPQQARIKDVIEPEEPTPAELKEQEDQSRRRNQARLEDKQRSEVESALQRSREADQEARAAVQRAEEQTQQALDYRKRFGNTPSRRQQFKYKILAEETKAEAARLEAQKALERAKAAAAEANALAGSAQKAAP
jgi:hypothetical protein